MHNLPPTSPRQRPKRPNPKVGKPLAVVHKFVAALAKGSLPAWASTALIAAYVVHQGTQANVQVQGPIRTPQGLKWRAHGYAPNRRFQQVFLTVNGSTHTVTLHHGRFDESIDLIPGRNSIAIDGPGLMSTDTTVVVASDPAQVNCDCNNVRANNGGIIGALQGVEDLISGCRSGEEKIRTGAARTCPANTVGPAAWPKAP